MPSGLENSARFYGNPSVMGFNYDMAQGVSYEIDVSRPEGDRIRNLRFRGQPLAPAQKLRIAVNNYRAGGSGGGARGGGLATGRLTRAPKLPAAFGVDGLPLRSNVGDECGDSDDTVEEALRREAVVFAECLKSEATALLLEGFFKR